MRAPQASKATNPPWPVIWEISLAVAFAVLVAIGVVTVVLPELAEPPAETGFPPPAAPPPRRAGPPPPRGRPALGPPGEGVVSLRVVDGAMPELADRVALLRGDAELAAGQPRAA